MMQCIINNNIDIVMSENCPICVENTKLIECAACNYEPTKNSHTYKKLTTRRFVNQTYMKKVLRETQVVLVEGAAAPPPSFL